MKQIILIGAMLLSTITLNAQTNPLKSGPISISYFGHYGFHPGLKIGTQYDWKTWTKRKERKKGVKVKNKSLFMSPQVGFYVHPGNHSGLLINADFGYQRIKAKRGFYNAWSVGLGYMTQFNAGTTYVGQTDGSITTKRLASRGYFMPTLNYEFGQQATEQIAWFTKFSLGAKLNYNTGISPETFIELGIKFTPKK